jgi:[glutamine synthetase] adenylyltransferase / [glutamine synthetase]-adenylyl-L-tyrosine phosphorylase
MFSVDSVPAPLQAGLSQQWESWKHRASDDQQQRLQTWLNQDEQHGQQLARMWVASKFVADVSLNQPEAFVRLLESGDLHRSLNSEQIAERLQQRVGEELDDSAFDRVLRQFRRDTMVRILWRDFCRLAPLMETTGDMTSMAEAAIQTALAFHYKQLQPRWGVPIGRDSGKPQPMVVLGMGKLGGWELNVSSDIDLIFSYPESGDTEGGRKSVSNQEFFTKLSQKLIASIDTTTVDGFVFRVDMRLRPYGQSGSMVLNFGSMEQYYQTQGRDWERYAMIKARVVSGDAIAGAQAAGEELMALLKPFTYRKYLDFSAIESMRDMKVMINREVQRKGIGSDVKLGSGGIREVEFIVQVFQMIRGGRDDRLHERRVLKLLPMLEEEGYLPEHTAEPLAEAYCFLRNTEHGIQGYQDRQTQSLPIDELDQLRLAWVMGFDGWDDFDAVLQQHRQQVNHQFQNVIADPEEEAYDDQAKSAEAEISKRWAPLWLQGPEGADEDELCDLLRERGVADAEPAAKAIASLHASRFVKAMQAEGRQRLDSLMPRLLECWYRQGAVADALGRTLGLLEAVTRRTAYMLLLIENPGALQQLITLCGASGWIAEQLTQHPALLDELLNPNTLYNPPNREELRDELRQQTLRLEWSDLEGQMETLRYFRMAHALRVAASEVSGALPLMKVSDYLTWLAEAILEHVQELAWQQMLPRHGYPGGQGDSPHPRFIVLGYGKMGGIELGHGSDLDLVFIHNADSKGYSDGDKPLDTQTFYTRMAQKMIHILNTRTVSGQLYEVDMRLRPSGNSGLLVSHLAAFEKYQLGEAWTWEHQALTRARVVCGDQQLGDQFDRLRRKILCQPRELTKLRTDVIEMREKMRQHLGSKGSKEQARQFHLKQDAGGIVDIEFLVQYSVLAWAHKVPELTTYSDNIRILEQLQQAGLMEADDANVLAAAYKEYRSAGHKLALQGLPGKVAGDEFIAERDSVKRIWKRYLTGDCSD